MIQQLKIRTSYFKYFR